MGRVEDYPGLVGTGVQLLKKQTLKDCIKCFFDRAAFQCNSIYNKINKSIEYANRSIGQDALIND